MNHIRFDWSKEKNSANQKKHGISFEEAQSVFVDENAQMILIPTIPATRIASFFSV